MSERDQNGDYYSILGVAEDASQSEIERHYRRKAVRHHPDLGGNEEDMKTLNEAYRILKDRAQRRFYDSQRQSVSSMPNPSTNEDAPIHTSRPAQVDAITHQVMTSTVFIVLGLALLFIVRFQYVIFLWPLALLAVFMIFVGIVQAHNVMGIARKHFRIARQAFVFVLVQEVLFWFFVFGGGYGVYLLLAAD